MPDAPVAGIIRAGAFSTRPGVLLNTPSEWLDEALRQRLYRSCCASRRSRKVCCPPTDAPGVEGATSAEASNAIERLLDRELNIPEPPICRLPRPIPRAHAGRAGERAHLRHVLFAVTPGLTSYSCASGPKPCCSSCAAPTMVARVPRRRASGPTAQWQQGGDLGWLPLRTAPPNLPARFWRSRRRGVLARLVHSRFGLHVVEG